MYCPATPRPLLEPGPLSRGATREQTTAHDTRTSELARYKPGRLTRDDPGGYHRVQCPAAMGKIRCPLRPASMRLDRNRPEILHPPQNPQACCTQQTLTVPPQVNAKTRQKHDYPSAAHRRSCTRRTGAERSFATIKDPASNDIGRGWCRLMGLAPLMLFTTCLLITRNQRILAAWNARQEENTRRAAKGLPPRTRRHRRKTLATLTAATRPPQATSTTTSPSSNPDTVRRQRQHARKPPRQPGSHQADTERTPHGNSPATLQTAHPMSAANVNIGLTET